MRKGKGKAKGKKKKGKRRFSLSILQPDHWLPPLARYYLLPLNTLKKSQNIPESPISENNTLSIYKGVPLLILEVGLGQSFQGGDAVVY